MKDMLLNPEILESLTFAFGIGSVLILITIFLDQILSNLKNQYIKRLELRNAGILANAIDSRIRDDDKFYQMHLLVINKLAEKSLNRKIIKNLLNGLSSKVKGSYSDVIHELIKQINAHPANTHQVKPHVRQIKSSLLSVIPYKAQGNDDLFLGDLVEYFDIENNPEINLDEFSAKLTKWQRTSLLHQLKNRYDKEELYLDRALRSNNLSIISFSADLIRLTGSVRYLIQLIRSLERLGDPHLLRNILPGTLDRFVIQDHLELLKEYILTESSFDTKRILLEHIKNNCFIQNDNQRWL